MLWLTAYDSRSGAIARRVKGALNAHARMRAEGRTPGEEGRAAIAAKRRVLRPLKSARGMGPEADIDERLAGI